MQEGNSPSFNRQITAMYKGVHINPYTKKVTSHVSKNTKNFIESTINHKEQVNFTHNKLSEEDIQRLKRELFELNIPCENIETQLAGIQRKRNQMGALNFDMGVGNGFRKSNSAIFVASTASGKTVTTLGSLIFEIVNPFNQVVYFAPRSSAENQHVQQFKELCKRVTERDSSRSASGDVRSSKKQLMHFFHFVTDDDKPITWSPIADIDEYRKKEMNGDGTIKSLYLSPFGSVFIFDDLQNKSVQSPVYKLMEECSIAGRHKLINWIACFQSAIRLNSKLLDNCEKLFISKALIQREDIWKKLKRAPPSNIEECVEDPDPPRFYIVEDDMLVPYNNLSFSNLTTVISKLKSKLPACILDEERRVKYMERKRIVEEYEKSLKNAERARNDKNGKPEIKEQDPDELKSGSIEPLRRELDNAKKVDIVSQILNKGKKGRNGGIRLIHE